MMGSPVYDCTAYPFIITHDCPAEYCKKEIRSLIVLRSPRRVKSIKFDPRILSYRSPLDFGSTNDSSLQHHTLKIAEDHGMTLAQMALAFVTDRPFMTSNIIGATSLEQLNENIDSATITLSEEVLKAINEVHAELPNPAP